MNNNFKMFEVFLKFINMKPTKEITTKDFLNNIKDLGYTCELLSVLVGKKEWRAYNILKNNKKVAFVEVDRTYTFRTLLENIKGLKDEKLLQEIINYSNTKLGDRNGRNKSTY